MDFPITNDKINEFLALRRLSLADTYVRLFVANAEMSDMRIYHLLLEQMDLPDCARRSNFRVLLGRRKMFNDEQDELVLDGIRKVYAPLMEKCFPDACITTAWPNHDLVYMSFANPMFTP